MHKKSSCFLKNHSPFATTGQWGGLDVLIEMNIVPLEMEESVAENISIVINGHSLKHCKSSEQEYIRIMASILPKIVRMEYISASKLDIKVHFNCDTENDAGGFMYLLIKSLLSAVEALELPRNSKFDCKLFMFDGQFIELKNSEILKSEEISNVLLVVANEKELLTMMTIKGPLNISSANLESLGQFF